MHHDSMQRIRLNRSYLFNRKAENIFFPFFFRSIIFQFQFFISLFIFLSPPFSYPNSYLHSIRSFAISQSRYRLFVQFSDTCFSYERSFYCDYLRTLCLVQFGSVAMEFSLSSQKSILDMRRRLAENTWQRHIWCGNF